jgi:poly(A) polymerase
LKACARARDKLESTFGGADLERTQDCCSAADPGRALLWMRQTGVLSKVLPETEKWGIDSIGPLIATEPRSTGSPIRCCG